jgi:hypothetical protein
VAGDDYVLIGELRRQRTLVKRFKDWERWKLMFPFLAILIVYPISKFVGVGDELVNAFGHGDLLLFSALVLIELSIEATHINKDFDNEIPDKMDSLIENARFFGAILIFIYGAMKLLLDHGSSVSHIDPERAKAFCLFSLSVTLLVVSFSIFAFWKALKNVVCGDKK